MAVVAKMWCAGVEHMGGHKSRMRDGVQVLLCTDGQWHSHAELPELKAQAIEPITTEIGFQKVRLNAVYSTSADDPNKAWAASTPSGNVELLISNSDAFDKIKAGREYFVEIREVMPSRARA